MPPIKKKTIVKPKKQLVARKASFRAPFVPFQNDGLEAAADSQDGGVVPYTIAEFEYIRDNFEKTEDVEVLQTIFDLLLMWETKVDMPTVLIDITKIVVEGLLYDKKHVDRSDGEEGDLDATLHLSLVYGTVITRFVNYIEGICKRLDGDVAANPPPAAFPGGPPIKVTMFDAAHKLGLPDEVVATRHAIVHRAMPPLRDLRKTVRACRRWLWDVHWSQPIEIALNVIGVPVRVPERPKVAKISAKQLGKMFAEYAAFRVHEHRRFTPREAAHHRRLLFEIQLLIANDVRNVLPAFATAFLLNGEQLRQLGLRQPPPTTREWEIPSKWLFFWLEILELMEELGVMGRLIEHMAEESVLSVNWWARLQHVAWVKRCLHRLKVTSCRLADWDVKRIVAHMAKAGRYFEWADIEQLLSSTTLSIDSAALRSVWEAAREAPSDEMEVITLDDEEDVMVIEGYTPRPPAPADGNWTLARVPQPLGLAVGQKAAELNLCVRMPAAPAAQPNGAGGDADGMVQLEY